MGICVASGAPTVHASSNKLPGHGGVLSSDGGKENGLGVLLMRIAQCREES